MANAERNTRPQKKDTRAQRPSRTPVSGFRDKLTVSGKDPNFMYRWVADYSEDGQRIWAFDEAGYEFVKSDEVEGVGQNHVYESSNVGSIVRRPSGDGRYLYLMKVPREFYEETQQMKEEQLRQMERDIERQRDENTDDGMYGRAKLSRSLD